MPSKTKKISSKQRKAVLKTRGGFAPGGGGLPTLYRSASRLNIPRVPTWFQGLGASIINYGAQRGIDLATEAAASAAEKAMGAAAEASESFKENVKKKGRKAGETLAKGVEKLFVQDPNVVQTSIAVGKRQLNNAVVPDKQFTVSVKQGGMTPRELKFYTKWPKQKLLLYQSKTVDRLINRVSPGSKSFYYPTNGAQPLVSRWVNIPRVRKQVQMSTTLTPGVPASEPPYLPSNLAYGTVQGGLDFNDALNLGTWHDITCCVSAMTSNTSLDAVPSQGRIGGNNVLKFGIPSIHLGFHIENQNKYLPGSFTIQVHEYIGATGIADLNPIKLIFDATNTSGTVPEYARTFIASEVVPVMNSNPVTDFTYTAEKSLLFNSPTFGKNFAYDNLFKMIASQKVRLTAGGRCKCDFHLHLPTINLLELARFVPTTEQAVMRNRQLHVTILAQGTDEVIGDVYQSGSKLYTTSFMTNPLQYTVTNIEKSAYIYAPQLQFNGTPTTGFTSIAVELDKFATEVSSFGEQRTTQFVPQGQYDIPYSRVVSAEEAATAIGAPVVVIPLMTDQSRDSAGSRLKI